MQCVDSVFPNDWILEACKRFTSQEDKDRLGNMFDIFEHTVAVQVVNNMYFKYFEYTDATTGTESNSAYLNTRARKFQNKLGIDWVNRMSWKLARS